LRHPLPAILLLALPAAASAVELNASVEAGLKYDDNVFNEEDHTNSDLASTLTPNLSLLQQFSRGQARLSYSAALEHYYLQQDIRENAVDVNHFGSFGSSYALTPRTAFTLTDRIESTLNHEFNFERDALSQDPDAGGIDEDVQGRTTLNELSAELEHQFTRRFSSGLSGNHQLYRSEDPDQLDSQAFGANWSLDYQVDKDHVVGLDTGSSIQLFERFLNANGNGTLSPVDDVGLPRSRTLVAQTQATWTWRVLPETSLSASVGPAWIQTRRESCLCARAGGGFFLLEDSKESRLTVFASAAVSQRLGENFRGRLGYQRSTSAASGSGGSSVRDSVNGSLNWQVGPRLSTSLLASWVLRQSATDLDTRPSGSEVDSTRWSAGIRGAYQITRQLSGTARLDYNIQDNEGSTGNSRNFNNFEALVGLLYTFDRFVFFD